MREGWEMKRLSEVCDIRPPKKIAKEKIGQTELVSFVPMSYLSTNKKYFSSPETKTLEKAYSGYVYFENNDVILAKITPCFENGKLGIAKDLVNGIGFGSSEYVVYRVKNYLIPEFLYYYLNQESFRKVGKSLMTGAVGHKRIPKEFYEQYEIPIPPLAEQKQIVALLDATFAKIDQAKANIEKNVENARELFQSKLNEIFSQQGDCWEERKLGEVCKIKPPKKLVKERLTDSDLVSFVPMKYLGVNQMYFSSDETRTLKKVYSGYVYFEENDVILAKITPCFENGKLGIAKTLKNGIGFGSSEYIVYRTKRDELTPEFLYFFLNRESFRAKGKSLMSGAVGHKRIQPEFYQNEKIFLPSVESQIEICNSVTALQDKLNIVQERYKDKLQNLEELKKSLLQKAFAGELT